MPSTTTDITCPSSFPYIVYKVSDEDGEAANYVWSHPDKCAVRDGVIFVSRLNYTLYMDCSVLVWSVQIHLLKYLDNYSFNYQ